MSVDKVSRLPLRKPDGGKKVPEAEKPSPPAAIPEPAKADPSPAPITPLRQRPQSKPRRGTRRLIMLAAGVLLIVATVLGVRYLVPHTVSIAPVTHGDLPLILRAPGTLDADQRTIVASRLQGRLVSLSVSDGAHVEPGDEIARIKSDDLQAALDAATASWQAAKLATQQAEADLARAQVSVDDAQQTLDRQKRLLDKGTIPQSAYDAAQSAFLSAQTGADSAEAALDRARALEQSALASVDGARANLGETTISAPFAGTIISTSKHVGDIVSPGERIAELVDPATLVLAVRLDETAISRVHLNDPVTLTFSGDAGSPIQASIVQLGTQVDAETREFTVEAKLDTLPARWAIGQRGIATIETGRLTDVLSIPTDFLQTRRGAKGAWRLEDGRAVWQPIVLGQIGGDAVEVLSGLERGDEIVWPEGAFQWMPVTPQRVSP
ncbi:MAG: efflux RND transporter periplasmic adaptor subunit [Hyphomicrobiaceae bacterium]|nr:efflux RND transporter periplasmic adaptor subunit [Hyphomicrobiaceae bacterium]MCC0022929.1 efflux RND transporter periplasmic adaptor subunit [Hyphomicrobiaceae bacterium]